MPPEEVRRARIWIVILIGIGVGWAMTETVNLVAGVITGGAFVAFLLIRRGRV